MPANNDISELRAILPKSEKVVTLEQMDEAIRKRSAARCSIEETDYLLQSENNASRIAASIAEVEEMIDDN